MDLSRGNILRRRISDLLSRAPFSESFSVLAVGLGPVGGLRQFVVGTGGGVLRPAVRVAPASELIIDDAYGILELSLSPGSYA